MTLLLLIAVGIGLNVLGTTLNGVLGTPLFIDNTGTILAAMLGGYIPCITVGFFSNIIGGFSSPDTTYYCIISVFIAIAASHFADKKMLTRFPQVIVAVLTFAFLGGVMGGALTWLIYGFSFGEGFAADFAASINSIVPVGYLPSNLISNFLIDIADKVIVTALALLIFVVLPRSLKDSLSRQKWAFLTVLNKTDKANRSLSVRLKITLLVVVSTTLVAVSAIGTCFAQYHTATVAEYAETGKFASKLIADRLDRSQLESYLAQGRSAGGYNEFENMLEVVRESSPEIEFIYVYRIEQDGTRVIFDLDTEGVRANAAGEVIPHDKTITKYLDELLRGEEIPVDISDDTYGWVLSVYRPVRDDSGKTLCYVGTDMSMDRLRSEEFSFLSRIISIFIGFLILIRTYAVWMAESRIIKPLNKLTDAVQQFSYDTAQTREESIKMIENLDISTGDEIEKMYHAYRKTASDTVKYIDQVHEKSAQISKLQNGLIMVLADMVENRDKCTGDHVRKTAAYADLIMRKMKEEGIYADRLTEEFISEVVSSAPLHDVGKIAVPDTILNKPGRLTDDEFKIIQHHTTAGGEIIDKAINIVDGDTQYLTEAKNLASYHHEKWNGTGYPNGLAGEDIPLSARVMAVADVFDALVSRRSYKEPFTIEQALDIIREGSGSHFDPMVVKAFLDAEDEVRRVQAINMEIFGEKKKMMEEL